MKTINLTRGLVALVDDEDYDYLMQWKWRALKAKRNGPKESYYAIRTTARPNRKCIYMHREVLIRSGGDKEAQCDHVDADGLNNQRENLRFATASQNHWNRRKKGGCSSRFKGVYWHKNVKRWMSRIYCLGKSYYLGVFDNEIEAAQAYNDAAIRYFGEFAKLNTTSS